MGNNLSLVTLDFTMSPTEVHQLNRQFKKLNVDRNGKVAVGDLISIAELAQNPLVGRICDMFDHDGEVDFRDLTESIGCFAVEAPRSERLKFTFRLYDIDRDGYISNGELFSVMKLMIGSNIEDVQLQQIVDRTILYTDKNGDDKISFEEFEEATRDVSFTGIPQSYNENERAKKTNSQ